MNLMRFFDEFQKLPERNFIARSTYPITFASLRVPRMAFGANMTTSTNARIAGITFLAYICAGISGMLLSATATRGTVLSEEMTSLATHTLHLRIALLLGLVQAVCAILLGVMLFAITRVVDSDLARLGLAFRVGEGLLGAMAVRKTLDLLWLGTSGPNSNLVGLENYMLHVPGSLMGAIFFALGSTFIAYLLLKGRLIPVPLAWVGVLASVLLAICLPLQFAGFLGGVFTSWMWIPMLLFEVPLGIWLFLKATTVEQIHAKLIEPSRL